jgi:hypothetical protein
MPVSSTTFALLCSVFFFFLYSARQLLAEEFLQFIERAVPTLCVPVARLFVGQLVVS